MPGVRRRPIALLKLRKLTRVVDFLSKMQLIALNISNNPSLFPTPDPTIENLLVYIAELEEAETLARTHVSGSAAVRNVKYDVVLNSALSLLGYVQNLANLAMDYDAALNIINSSGFDVKERGVRNKNDFEARNTKITGRVKLISKSFGKHVAYLYYMSYDNEIWSMVDGRLQATTFINGLPPGTIVYFKVVPILQKGFGSYSRTVSLLVT